MDLIAQATRNVFFTGKGGVGKTTVAAATAIALADIGRRILLVCTDPASNLDEVLGVPLSAAPTAIDGVPGLFAMNIDSEAAAAAYRERVVGPHRGVLPAEAIASIEEQLSGACTMEIAAFDEFAKLLGSPEDSANFDHIVFDTAPTGHTLRLLELPAAWSDFLQTGAGGVSCLGPLSGLNAQKELYADTRRALADPQLTTIIVVSRPDKGALAEAERTSGELAALSVTNQKLVLNGIFFAADSSDPLALAFAARCRDALAALPAPLAALPRIEIPLAAVNMLSAPTLRRLFNGEIGDGATGENVGIAKAACASFDDLIGELETQSQGVVMTMGKGGVGKTTLAAAIALRLSGSGHQVYLTTTDPAAHIAETVGAGRENLIVSRIDPASETKAYAAEVMATAGDALDDQGRALLAEDLRSPCTEEIAVFRAFARVVARGADGFVVIDTAPTGHTLLLLDAAEAYHRQVSHTMSTVPEEVKQLLPRLRDPDFTRVILVTLPEATPVHEAAALQRDLQRAGIEPFGWIINQSLTPHRVSDPLLASRRSREGRYISEAITLARSCYLIRWLAEPLQALGVNLSKKESALHAK
jgi:arsenite-transporting ATPase